METTLLEKPAVVGYEYNTTKLSEQVTEMIIKIEAWSKENDYRIIGNIEAYKNAIIKYKSHNQLKKINKYIFYLNHHMTLKKVNSFLSVLYKNTDLERVQIKKSLKEETIQNKRKQMLEARKLYEALLLEYKTEKGDFYKRK